MTARVLVISGNPRALARVLGEALNCPDPDLVAFEEKAITRPAFVHRLVRQSSPDVLCFATKQLELQRFQVVLSFYLLLGHARRRLILDEAGKMVAVTWPRFLLLGLPRFALEVSASAGILVASAVHLGILAASIRRRGAR